MSIHCILNFFDLFGFLRHYLLNLIGLPHSMSNVDHCRSIPIKFALLIPMLIKKDQHFFMTLQSLLTSFVPLPKIFFYCLKYGRESFQIGSFMPFTQKKVPKKQYPLGTIATNSTSFPKRDSFLSRANNLGSQCYGRKKYLWSHCGGLTFRQ